MRDCGAGFFCNSTVLRDERGVAQDVKVCAPGAVNHAGRYCTTQSDCDLASTTLLCSGATSSTPGICTKPCDTSASCSSSDNPAVCGKNSAGQGFCFQSCTGDTCIGGLVCRNNLCLPASAAAPTLPTPSFGQTGGACTADRDCPGGFCGTTSPGGSCSAGCTSDSQCGQNGVCVTLVSGRPSFCFAKCSTPDTKSNCRSQYLCRPLRDVSYGFCDRG